MSEETPAIEVEETPSRPEWLPENFSDPEGLVKSYKELERTYHADRQRIKELEEQAQRAQEWEEWYQQQQTQQRLVSDDPREKFLEVWEDPDRQPQLVLHMAERLAQAEQMLQQFSKTGPDPTLTEISAEYAQNRMRAQYDDWDQFADKVAEAVQANPRILGITEKSTPAELAQALDSVYWMEKGKALTSSQQSAAQDAAEAARLAKQQAQTMSGASSRPATQTEAEEYVNSLMEIAKTSGGYGS